MKAVRIGRLREARQSIGGNAFCNACGHLVPHGAYYIKDDYGADMCLPCAGVTESDLKDMHACHRCGEPTPFRMTIQVVRSTSGPFEEVVDEDRVTCPKCQNELNLKERRRAALAGLSEIRERYAR